MIKGKRGKYGGSKTTPYKVLDWVMVNTGQGQIVCQIKSVGVLSCELCIYKNEVWTEVESGLERVEITSVTHHVPVTSIAFSLPEEVAKNLLLLQGVEL